MGEKKNPASPAAAASRRQVIAAFVLALGGLAVRSEGLGETLPAMTERPSIGPNKMRCFLHQVVDFNAMPKRIYELLLDSKQFAAFSGEPAEIGRDVGSAFSMFGGKIVGRTIELVPDQRIVQAWRPADWDPGIYSIVRFELIAQGSRTRVVLDHTGFPEGTYDHLNAGWKLRYWDPIEKYLA